MSNSPKDIWIVQYGRRSGNASSGGRSYFERIEDLELWLLDALTDIEQLRTHHSRRTHRARLLARWKRRRKVDEGSTWTITEIFGIWRAHEGEWIEFKARVEPPRVELYESGGSS